MIAIKVQIDRGCRTLVQSACRLAHCKRPLGLCLVDRPLILNTSGMYLCIHNHHRTWAVYITFIYAHLTRCTVFGVAVAHLICFTPARSLFVPAIRLASSHLRSFPIVDSFRIYNSRVITCHVIGRRYTGAEKRCSTMEPGGDSTRRPRRVM